MKKTRLCQLLGIEYPIIQAPMAWITCAELVAAVSEARGLGTLGPEVGTRIQEEAKDLDAEEKSLREQIRKVKALTNKPFAVNFPIGWGRQKITNQQRIATAINEGIPIAIVSMGSPGSFTQELHNAGAKVIHVVTSVKQARKAVKVAKIAGLRTVGYFMIGMLGENREKILKTIEFAKSLDLDSGGFSRVTPLPGTQLYKLARQRGYIKNDKYATSTVFGGDINLTDDLSSEEIDEYVEKAYWEFFWSRSSRLLPYSICNLISMLFPIIYKIIRGNTGIFVHIDELRRLLRLPQL